MPCPLFLPANRQEGTCAADPGVAIGEELLRICCQRGYARQKCTRADRIETDAVRFLIRKDSDGEVEVAWSLEKDHHPVAVGTVAAGTSTGDATLDHQIAACVADYLSFREETKKLPRP